MDYYEGLSLDDTDFILKSMLRRVAMKRDKKPFGTSSIQRDFFMGYGRAERIKAYGIKTGILKQSEEQPYLVEFIFQEQS